MSVSESTKRLAAKAADEVEQRGLCKRKFHNPSKVRYLNGTPNYDDCEVCAWGALKLADGRNPTAGGTSFEVWQALEQIQLSVPFGVALDTYSDLPETTQADVVALFREVAAA